MTVTEIPRPITTPAPLATREDALKFMGSGRTAEGLRAVAGNPETVAALAQEDVSPETARATILAIADEIDKLTAEGVTAPDCWRILGWSLDYVEQVLGPREDGAE